MWMSAVSVQCEGLYADWYFSARLFLAKCASSWSIADCSKIFERYGRLATGR